MRMLSAAMQKNSKWCSYFIIAFLYFYLFNYPVPQFGFCCRFHTRLEISVQTLVQYPAFVSSTFSVSHVPSPVSSLPLPILIRIFRVSLSLFGFCLAAFCPKSFCEPDLHTPASSFPLSPAHQNWNWKLWETLRQGSGVELPAGVRGQKPGPGARNTLRKSRQKREGDKILWTS